ncbi:TPA: ead/Ea22-like family protein [Enterobacter asburiae]|nr:ead/Ea22-like family protein [Enterobacter asburiae]
MSNIDKRALREAAEKATPGRIGDRIDGSGSIKYQCFGNDGSLVLQTDYKNMEYGFIGGNSEADELFFRLCDPSAVLALLNELEESERLRLKFQEANCELCQKLEAAEKRIAELELKLESADKLQDSAFRHGLQHGFSLGQTDNQAGFEECLSAYGTGKGE